MAQDFTDQEHFLPLAIRGSSHVVPMLPLSPGGDSQVVNIASSSNPTVGLSSTRVVVTCTQPCFARAQAAPIAVSNGTDRYLLGGVPYAFLLQDGWQIAFIKPSAGSDGLAYVTPIPSQGPSDQ